MIVGQSRLNLIHAGQPQDSMEPLSMASVGVVYHAFVFSYTLS